MRCGTNQRRPTVFSRTVSRIAASDPNSSRGQQGRPLDARRERQEERQERGQREQRQHRERIEEVQRETPVGAKEGERRAGADIVGEGREIAPDALVQRVGEVALHDGFEREEVDVRLDNPRPAGRGAGRRDRGAGDAVEMVDGAARDLDVPAGGVAAALLVETLEEGAGRLGVVAADMEHAAAADGVLQVQRLKARRRGPRLPERPRGKARRSARPRRGTPRHRCARRRFRPCPAPFGRRHRRGRP